MIFDTKPIVCILCLVLFGFGSAHATVFGKQVSAAIELEGGSKSNAKWKAPLTSAYKVHVFIPKNGTSTNTLYRVYPKGKREGSAACLSTDAKFPCYEVTIDQTQHQGTWTQLMLNGDPATEWDFVRGRGYVMLAASNLGAGELLSISALLRFENQSIAIGKTYQGGLVFYVDGTGEHGLVAAPSDQSANIEWTYGAVIDTGATDTGLGTGQANTIKIINAQGTIGAYAAKLAADLVLNGYDDWFLPSPDELELMYANIGPGAAAPLTNIGGFASLQYWSSSQFGFEYALTHDFVSGLRSAAHRYSFLPVRAVRAF